jgi:L-galactose dehydrogenase/L-glyceraldehyde 3-phosphate reductase
VISFWEAAMSGPDEDSDLHLRVPCRVLGRTGLLVSRLAFGAGPVSGLMTGKDFQSQAETFRALIELGINWIDTAAGYGNGSSEANIGRILAELPGQHCKLHVATKVRIDCSSSLTFRDQVQISLEASLNRLQLPKVSLLQLHNGITAVRHEQPDSVSVADVLDPDGILDALKAVQAKGLADFIGLTATGTAEPMRRVVRTGAFDTIQVPYNLLNPSAGQVFGEDFPEQNYGNILHDCRMTDMGCFVIRVFAGGALLGLPPSPHTLKTPYFPLDLYRRDLIRSANLANAPGVLDIQRKAVEFSLAHAAVHSAIIGFGAATHVADAARALTGSCSH